MHSNHCTERAQADVSPPRLSAGFQVADCREDCYRSGWLNILVCTGCRELDSERNARLGGYEGSWTTEVMQVGVVGVQLAGGAAYRDGEVEACRRPALRAYIHPTRASLL
jgi:hypothetical protein